MQIIQLIPGARETQRVYHPRGISPALNTAQGGQRVPKLLVLVKSINAPAQSLNTTGLTSKIMATSIKSTGLKFPTLICSLGVVLVRTYPSQENEQDLLAQGADFFTSICEPSVKKGRDILSGKMLRGLCQARMDGILAQSSMKWPKQGILSGGKFSTPKISVCLKTESVSLSSVLETDPPQKYFLSERAVESVLSRINKGTHIVSKRATTNTEAPTLRETYYKGYQTR